MTAPALPFRKGVPEGQGMFRNNQKSPYRKIANCAIAIIVPKPAIMLTTFGKGCHEVAGYASINNSFFNS